MDCSEIIYAPLIYVKLNMVFAAKCQSKQPHFSVITNKGKVVYIRPPKPHSGSLLMAFG